MTSDSIGRYQLSEEIGRGGMAAVFRAHDPLFKRDVAIKLMTQDLLKDPNLRARFDREAQTIAALEHPAIVPVYDFGEEDGRPFLVMRLMTGKTLSERLEHGPLSIENTSTILTRIGSALDRAHSKGIIHRDLKPTNIMFDDYGDAFLADFGIARLTESAVTLTGDSVIGTPAYMSPEQIHGDKSIDGRSDIYALGVICFEMLTGERPYVDKTPAKVMMKHILDPVPNIRDVNPDLPHEVESVIAHTMAKDPDERYRSSQELSDTLQRLARAGTMVTPAAVVRAGEPDAALVEPEDQRTEIKPPGPETQVEAADITEAEKSKQVEEAAEEEFPQTEVAVPSFVEKGAPVIDDGPETEIAAIDEDFPETQAAVPSFVGAPAPSDQAQADSEQGSNRKWILIGGIGLIGVIMFIAVISGGIFLISQASDGDEGDEPVPTSTVLVAVQATSRPASTSIAAAGESVPDADLAAQGDELLNLFYDRIDNEDFDGALEVIEEAISLEPDNLSYQHERAATLFNLGDYDGALEGLDAVIEENPGEPTYYELRSAIFREMGDLSAALEEAQRAIKLGSTGVFGFVELGDSFMDTEEYEEAIKAYTQAINIEPNNQHIYRGRATAYELAGDYEAAVFDLEKAILLDPDEVGPYEQLADLYQWSIGDLDAAVETWTEVISVQPENAEAYSQRGAVLSDLGDLEGALDDILTAVRLQPEESSFHIQLAQTYGFLGEGDSALKEFQLAIDLNPNDFEAYYQRANSNRWELNDYNAALADYTKAIELNPEASWIYVDRASLYLDLDDHASSLADLERAIFTDPLDSWLYIEKAATFEDLGDIEAALQEYDRAIRADPGNPSIYEYRAKLFVHDLDDYDAAFADLERCIEIDPEYPWCFLDWGWALDDIGDVDGAISKFERFVEFVHPFDCPECVDEVQSYIDDNS